MKYPKIPRDLLPNVKIKTKDIQEIRELSASGWSQRKIARNFGVSKFTVSRYLMSEEKLTEIRDKQRTYNRLNPRDSKSRRGEGRQVYQTRKRILGETALSFNSLEKIRLLTPEKRLESWDFHKEKLGRLLEVDPLLILFVSQKDRIRLQTTL